jgi:hypothetical protein
MFTDNDESPRLSLKHKGRLEEFRGDEAMRHARRIVPAINSSGDNRKTVQAAVQILEVSKGPDEFLRRTLHANRQLSSRDGTPLSKISRVRRLALEMALHEEAERHVIEGELAALEEAWREAEEIASISDNLFIAPDVERKLSRMKTGNGSPIS